jgi:hypothetical protein
VRSPPLPPFRLCDCLRFGACIQVLTRPLPTHSVLLVDERNRER